MQRATIGHNLDILHLLPMAMLRWDRHMCGWASFANKEREEVIYSVSWLIKFSVPPTTPPMEEHWFKIVLDVFDKSTEAYIA